MAGQGDDERTSLIVQLLARIPVPNSRGLEMTLEAIRAAKTVRSDQIRIDCSAIEGIRGTEERGRFRKIHQGLYPRVGQGDKHHRRTLWGARVLLAPLIHPVRHITKSHPPHHRLVSGQRRSRTPGHHREGSAAASTYSVRGSCVIDR